jgi:hypothetical protein
MRLPWSNVAMGLGLGFSTGVTQSHRSGILNRTPNDLKLDGVHRDVVQWCLCPGALSGYGAMALIEASVPADLTTWDEPAGIQAITGSGPYVVRGDGLSGKHYFGHSVATSYIYAAWSDMLLTSTRVGSQQWVRLSINRSTNIAWFNFDIINGVTGNTSASGPIGELSVDGTEFSIRLQQHFIIASVPRPRVHLLSSDDANDIPADFVLSTGDGLDVDSAEFIQPRASAWADESLLDDGTERGADLAPVGNAQPLFYERFKTVNNLTALFGEDDRSSYLETNHADPVGAGSGDDPPCAVIGVASCESGGQLFRWDGAGGEYQYLFRDGAELKLIRHDGASSDTQTFGSGLGSLLDSPQMIHLFGLGGRQWVLCIGGVYRDTVTMADLASATMTSFRPFNATGTGSVVMAEFALFGDLSSLSTWSAILAKLQNEAGGLAMQLRWNV